MPNSWIRLISAARSSTFSTAECHNFMARMGKIGRIDRVDRVAYYKAVSPAGANHLTVYKEFREPFKAVKEKLVPKNRH
jgi:hypothetical protein